MPQPSRGVIKAPVVEAATHRVCLSDITTSCDLDSRTAAHGKARTVTLESYRNTLRPAHGAKCGCLTSKLLGGLHVLRHYRGQQRLSQRDEPAEFAGDGGGHRDHRG